MGLLESETAETAGLLESERESEKVERRAVDEGRRREEEGDRRRERAKTGRE